MNRQLTRPAARPPGWPLQSPPPHWGTVQSINWAAAAGPFSVNGYAQIPAEGHPWCTVVDVLDLDLDFQPTGSMPLPFIPELTFGPGIDPVVTLADSNGWIGFDTQHAQDGWTEEELAAVGIELAPAELPVLRPMIQPARWWTVEEVVEVARALAFRIALVSKAIVEGEAW